MPIYFYLRYTSASPSNFVSNSVRLTRPVTQRLLFQLGQISHFRLKYSPSSQFHDFMFSTWTLLCDDSFQRPVCPVRTLSFTLSVLTQLLHCSSKGSSCLSPCMEALSSRFLENICDVIACPPRLLQGRSSNSGPSILNFQCRVLILSHSYLKQ